MAKTSPIYCRVTKEGAIVPADPYAASQMRERGFHTGDLLSCDFKKPRNPKFNRLVHRIGQLVAHHIEAFRGMDAHAAIKRLQWEGNIACEEVGVSLALAWRQFSRALLALPNTAGIEAALKVIGALLPSNVMLMMRTPRSLANAVMDEGEYQQVARALCRYTEESYWPSVSAAQIEAMADTFLDPV